jgi:hypothetical protein
MEGMIRSTGLKKQGLLEPGIASTRNQLRDSVNKHKILPAHLKKLGVRTPGLRQAVVPVRGLKPRAPQSVSARAQARANFSFNDLGFNRNPNYNPYT